MELLKATQINTDNPIPAFGVESKQKSDNEDKVSRIAVSAYYKAEARGYEPGHEMQDWLEAEAGLKKD